MLPQRPSVLAWLLGLEGVATLALIGSRRGGPALAFLLDLLLRHDRETGVRPGIELDRRGRAANHLGKLDAVADGRRDEDLAALVIVGDDRGHVGHVVTVILQECATAHHAFSLHLMTLLNRGKWVDDRLERMVKAGWQDPGGPRRWRVEPRTCP